MTNALLATKFFAPPQPVPEVARPQLLQQLEQGLAARVTLVCAAAGFGKSTLVSQWMQECAYPSAWLSLDPQDADPTRFLVYVLGALQRVAPELGAGLAELLQGSHPASAETVLTRLVNQLTGLPGKLVLVLDDCHLAASAPVNAALAFLLEHLPVQLHLVLLSREEPALPLGRLRLQGLLREVGPQQLRFGLQEAADFFQQGLSLKLSGAQVQALETRTEGWVAGLKLAALSLQGQPDPAAFVASFTGSHRFVQDYLLEEVLLRQPPEVQAFLLHTSVLERLCGPLCDAVLQGQGGQAMLERLEQAHLFIVPLDAHKRWYRYHHLFAELLRQRLLQAEPAAELHRRASQWFETEGLEAEAFGQATAAHDLARAMRLIAGHGMPLYLRGEAAPVLRWLATQSAAVRNAHPGLWLMLAWCLLITGQHSQIGAQLDGAEAALALGETTPALQGQLAVLRAWQAVSHNQVEAIRSNAQRALELLPAGSGPERTAAHCALGVAHLFGGNRDAARPAFAAVVEASRATGNLMFTVVASIALAGLQAGDFQLHQAAASYREVLALIRNPEDSVGYEAHLGLARILYEWNALDAAATHAQHSSQLSARAESESGLGADVLRARLLIHRGAHAEAETLLERIGEAARTRRFKGRMQEAAELQVLHWLHQGRSGEAHALANQHALPLGQARALLAQGQGREALGVATRYRQAMEAKGLAHETLKALVVQALVHQGLGEQSRALQVLQQALQQAAPQGALRLFADEGTALQELLGALKCPPGLQPYVARVLQAFGQAAASTRAPVTAPPLWPLDAFSERELEVLRLIQQGHSNQKISEQLFVSLSTVKWHNQNIFSKLDVQRRTQAVARALELKLL